MHSEPHVLVIEDDREIARAIGLRLRAAGYSTSTAHDGADGLAAAAEFRPACIVLDVRMPCMDGLTTLAKLRQRDATKRTPVVMLSASLVDQQKALDLGARFFVEKPYQAGTLITAVQSAMVEAGGESPKYAVAAGQTPETALFSQSSNRGSTPWSYSREKPF